MSKSPWSAYGRPPKKQQQQSQTDWSAGERDLVSGAVKNVLRGREQVDKCLDGAMREYNEIRSGRTGYQQIIADALAPSDRPETIEERLGRLAREAVKRNGRTPPSGTR